MKAVAGILAVILVALQYALWAGEGGVRDMWNLNRAVEAQERENAMLLERNQALEAEVKDLRDGLEAIEERARSELGMIREDETFYQIVE